MPTDIDEMMAGTMNREEMAKHMANMKKLRKFFSKQGDQMTQIPTNLTKGLKRKLYENLDFPQKRVQKFVPANGKPSINKVVARLDNFLKECFTSEGEYNVEHTYSKEASKKNCRFCDFNQTELCDAGVKA